MSVREKVDLVERNNKKITIERQAEILEISRAIIYYRKREISYSEKMIMNQIDEIYTEHPYYGTRKLSQELKRQGFEIGRDKTRTLMNVMGIEAIYPKPKTSLLNKEHKKYPYLLKNRIIEKPNQVWGVDITYIRMREGWTYLVAILDWYSRFVLSWKLSITLETQFCLECLNDALQIATPDIHNSDQGSQFTSHDYTNILKEQEIKISMDGRGRCFDNIFTERLWRTVKYEEVYLKDYSSVQEANYNLKEYFQKYNYRRIHQSLNYKTPYEIFNQ